MTVVQRTKRVDSIRCAGLVESCTRTCAGCRRNGETAVRRGHRRTGKCTARAVVRQENIKRTRRASQTRRWRIDKRSSGAPWPDRLILERLCCPRDPSFQIVLFQMRFFCICPPPRRQLSAFLDAFLTKCHPHPRQNTYSAFSKIAKQAQMVPVGLPFNASFERSDTLSALQKHCFFTRAFRVIVQKLIAK